MQKRALVPHYLVSQVAFQEDHMIFTSDTGRQTPKAFNFSAETLLWLDVI